MADKIPVKVTYDGNGDPEGLGEFQTGETVAIANGGTGQTTAQAAIDALVPDQSSSNGYFLKTDGTNVSWGQVISSLTISDGSVTDSVNTGQTITFAGLTGITTSVTNNTISIDLDDTAVTAQQYGSSTAIPVITVDQQGRITAAETASITTDLTVAADSGTPDSVSLATDTLTFTGDTGITTSVSNNQITIDLDDTAVTAASYGSSSAIPVLTIDQQGRITAASTASITTSLTVGADSGTNDAVALASDVLTFSGGTGVATTVSDNDISIAIGQAVSTTSDVTFNTVTADLTGDVTGDVTGNADTATTLATARTIGGVSFDGSANINLPGVNTTGNQDTSGNAATATALETARTIAGQSFNGTANISIAPTDLTGVTATATEINYVDGVTSNVQTQLDSKVAKSGSTMTGALTLSGDPTAANHAATKSYVDTIASAGLHYHNPVRGEVETNFASTYNNGTSGVGATLTATSNGAFNLGGISDWSVGERVLVYNQTNAAHNGVYTVTTVGDGSTAAVLTRATDADSYAPSDPDSFGEGDAFYVQEGDGAGELYVMNTSGTITFGTTNISFTQISSAQIYSGGTGITLNGTTFNLDSTISADTSGNAATATALATARTIGGVSFDGTASINLPGVNTSGNQDTSGNAATATALETARTIGGVSFDGTSNINLPGVNTAGNQDTSGNAASATVLETARTIGGVSFNGSANINLPGVNTTGNQNTSGNAATATKLATSRTISLTGDVTGSASFDGSANASISATIAANSVALGTDTTGNYVATITGGTGISVSGSGSENAAITISTTTDAAAIAAYKQSTLTTFPGASGDIDYGDSETYVGQSTTTDAFGYATIDVFSLNDPLGDEPAAIDLGAFS